MTTVPALTDTALESLVHEHLPLARRLATQFSGRGVEVDELVQVASLALVKAARGFDEGRGSFAPYATATIRGDIKKFFRDHAWSVRPPRRVQELQAAIAATTDKMPSARDVDALADELEVEPEDVTEALSARGCFRSESTDREVGASGLTIGDTLSCHDEELEQVDEWVTFCRLCRALAPEERELLRLRFIDDLTQQEIGDRLGVSQMQVSRRLRRVLDDLRSRAGVRTTPEAA